MSASAFFSNKTVVITGGSSGIGLASALAFARQGARLCLLARNRDRLEAAKRTITQQFPVEVQTRVCDISDRGAVEKTFPEIAAVMGGVDVLLNNAGIGLFGRLRSLHPEDLENALKINYSGAIWCVRAAWPYLKASRGKIAITGSVAGYLGLIGYGGYAPAKFALTGLAECIRPEAKADGIGLTIIYPPDTQTPFLEHERAVSLPETSAITRLSSVVSAELLAKKLLRGLEKGRFEVYCNAESRLFRWLRVLAPGIYFRAMDRIAGIRMFKESP